MTNLDDIAECSDDNKQRYLGFEEKGEYLCGVKPCEELQCMYMSKEYKEVIASLNYGNAIVITEHYTCEKLNKQEE